MKAPTPTSASSQKCTLELKWESTFPPPCTPLHPPRHRVRGAGTCGEGWGKKARECKDPFQLHCKRLQSGRGKGRGVFIFAEPSRRTAALRSSWMWRAAVHTTTTASPSSAWRRTSEYDTAISSSGHPEQGVDVPTGATSWAPLPIYHRCIRDIGVIRNIATRRQQNGRLHHQLPIIDTSTILQRSEL
jgi:hypothetical protein